MPVENLHRTAGFLATMAQRREELAAQLTMVFSGKTEFVWEVGSGHGHFLVAYAQANPSKLCIGIDIVSERIARARRKRDQAGLGNLHFIRAEAHLFLELIPTGATISDVFVLFPDPWPKQRHHKHRLMQSEFLQVVAGRASADCRLSFRTDFAPYFDEALVTVRSHRDWVHVEEPWPFEFETVFQRRAFSFQSFVARLANPAIR